MVNVLDSAEDRAALVASIAEDVALLERMRAACAIEDTDARATAIAEVTADMQANAGPLLFPAPLP